MLWGIKWINVQMMLADAPSYSTDDKEEELPKSEREKSFDNFLNNL